LIEKFLKRHAARFHGIKTVYEGRLINDRLDRPQDGIPQSANLLNFYFGPLRSAAHHGRGQYLAGAGAVHCRAAAGCGGAGMNPDPFDDCSFVFCGGGARPTDAHLASRIVCVDDEIIEWLERRERQYRKCREKLASANRVSCLPRRPDGI
jgi:hypothetical protein